MNPITTLKSEDIKAICRRHGIRYASHERITTGFGHEVHRLNDDLVIKLFNKTSHKNFLCESRMLAVEDSRILKPELVAIYQGGDNERSYIIMSYVEGVSLGSVWHLANNVQREQLVYQISGILKAFQDINPALLDFELHESWRDYLNHRVKKMCDTLLEKFTITDVRARQVKEVVSRLANYYMDSEVRVPVYWDIHFDNFIVDDQFQLKAIIDLENVRLLPIDYPLFVIEKQMRDPKKYLTEENEKFANSGDYAKLWEWYSKHYPEMFSMEHTEYHVKLYRLLDELHLMIDWSTDAELRESFARLLKELLDSNA
jgi:hypothetical protein